MLLEYVMVLVISGHNIGRIWILWNLDVFKVDILHQSAQIIHTWVTHKGLNRSYACSFIYGFNDAVSRKQLWCELKSLSPQIRGPWFVGGDFNCPLNFEDRIGSKVRLTEIRPFRECVEECELYDMKNNGTMFTWNNKQEGKVRVFSKIDHALVNMEWISAFPSVETFFLPKGDFDHCPTLVKFLTNTTMGNKPFKYFNMWSSAPDFAEKIDKSWKEPLWGTPMFCVMNKLKRLKPVLKELNKGRMNQIEKSVVETETKLAMLQGEIQGNPHNLVLINDEKALNGELRIVKEAKVSFLRQKSKLHWRKEGDQNTKFFH